MLMRSKTWKKRFGGEDNPNMEQTHTHTHTHTQHNNKNTSVNLVTRLWNRHAQQ